MIAKLIEELQSLEQNQEIQNKAPLVYINVPDGNGGVLSLTLALWWAQGKHNSNVEAMLRLVKAFRDDEIKSVCGRCNACDESIVNINTKDLDKRIEYISGV